ncbi:15-hydroxyprostaglandin dehydrogenase [NAD(+)]-like isoform X2 [Coccinella septempunctata]|uniref:15-hydroxyprostaglandin dehydrogenase [NAD(+)]-like isoform X2 n=1 Tax=Coccinella septempunctata TaxID=41139 RepID=UPI001D07A8ED|nr:15-hydroxyprostaglandin dehydrogenase [NAD(+)]-like isoform X2 [Coccinella septempunctata]
MSKFKEFKYKNLRDEFSHLKAEMAKDLIHKVRPASIEKIKNKLSGKVALLTGGASGIGYSIAKSFLNHGLSALTIADIHRLNGTEAIKDLTLQFGEDKVMFIECDVTRRNQLDLNNAGIMNDAVWEKEIHTNIGGCLIGSLLGLQYMSKTSNGNGGIIINMASIIGLMPCNGFPIHTMTQYGIVGLSRAFGGHYKRTRVKVIGFCPGLTQSQLIEKAHRNTLNGHFARVFRKEVEGCYLQHPDFVGDGLVKVIDKARPGSIWFIENNDQPHEVHFPALSSMIREKLY